MNWTRGPTIPDWYWFNAIAGTEVVSLEIAELDYKDDIPNTVSSWSCGEALEWPDIMACQGKWMGPME